MKLDNYLSENESAQALASKLCVSAGLVSQWRSGTRPISAKRCVQIERATDGAVTRRDLRPDDWHLIWPELPVLQEPA